MADFLPADETEAASTRAAAMDAIAAGDTLRDIMDEVFGMTVETHRAALQ